MRTFKLRNSLGAYYDLTVDKTSMLLLVGGLGYDEENTYQRIGHRFTTLKSYLKQGVVSGTVHFWQPKAHEEYQKFVKFCQFKPLTLIYNPTGVKEYYRRGAVTSVTYDESKPLEAGVKFTCSTPFFESVRVVTEPGSGGMIYGKIYDYTYPYRYSSTTTNNVTINMDSTVESPCKLILYGPLQNPEWKHYVNNELVSTGKVNITVPSGHYLVVDNTGDNLSIEEYDNTNTFVADRYQLSDFSTERAIYLEYGQNRIAIDDEGGNKVKVVAEGELYYASV